MRAAMFLYNKTDPKLESSLVFVFVFVFPKAMASRVATGLN